MPVPRIVAGDQSSTRRRFLGTRVPPNLFAIALGLLSTAMAAGASADEKPPPGYEVYVSTAFAGRVARLLDAVRA